MKAKLSTLPRRYEAALRKHLAGGEGARLHPARGLGRQAVALGLETLDVARMHAQAMAERGRARSARGVARQADRFFAEAIGPIEQTHEAARAAEARLGRLSEVLGRRTGELAGAHQLLRQGIARRQTVEQALRKSAIHHARLLRESRRLQMHLRRLTHRILSAHEAERKQVSHELHDEVAQTLLGINVRLVALKAGAAANMGRLKKEIATTEGLVEESFRTIRRFVREIGRHHAT
jgi:signal transduction histidine kinase